MIRRFWRWLLDDDPDAALRESAARLAAAVRDLSDEESAELSARFPQVWWHASGVAACVWARGEASR